MGVQTTARTIMAFRLFRAATAIPLAISTMSATTATGGVARSAVPTSPTAGTWATTSSLSAGTTTTSLTCGVFVVSRTERVVLAKQTLCAAASRKAGGVALVKIL